MGKISVYFRPRNFYSLEKSLSKLFPIGLFYEKYSHMRFIKRISKFTYVITVMKNDNDKNNPDKVP